MVLRHRNVLFIRRLNLIFNKIAKFIVSAGVLTISANKREYFITIIMQFRFGPTRTTHLFQLAKWFWIEMHPTILLKLNKVHLILQAWYPELNPHRTKCSRVVFSHTMILTFIVLVWTTIICLSTVHTSAVLIIINVMARKHLLFQVSFNLWSAL